MKYLIFDVETTGTMHWKNCIHQLSFSIVVDGELKETHDLKVKPHPKAAIEEEALKVSGVTLEQIQSYPEQQAVHSQLTEILSKYVNKFDKKDKFFLLGYNNASFDNNFLRAFFTQCNDKYFGSWFWSSSIDVMVLAAEFLKKERHLMEDFKLKTVAAYMGLDVDESRLHDATYDLELTYKIYQLITTQ